MWANESEWYFYPMRDYHCYLFDADGTLIDTGELVYQCFKYTIGKFAGRDVTRAEVMGLMGLPLKKSFEHFFGPISPLFHDTLRVAHMEYQLSIYQQHLRAFPTVAEGLAALRQKGKKLGVVTSRMRQTLDLYLKKTGLFDYFDVLVTPADTERHKPEPEPVLKAMELLGVEKETTIYIGDAVFDIECGSRAGVDTGFVGWSGNAVSTLVLQPTHIIKSLSELVTHTT